jgi:hypothetical protein
MCLILVHLQKTKLNVVVIPGKNNFVPSFPNNDAKKDVVPKIYSRLTEQCQASKLMIFAFKVPFYLQHRMRLQHANNLET